MHNTISQYAIGELMDGRYFYIPAYQRGYRWTEKQVGDLLRDLLCFANETDKYSEDFYCLQPVIAKKVTDNDLIADVFGEDQLDRVKAKGIWEIVDGQQRLTTLFLIFKYILVKENWDAETLREEVDEAELYHIHYATRKGSTAFLEGMSEDMLGDSFEMQCIATNIDFYHMVQAFRYIDKWIKTDGKDIHKRYNLGGNLRDIRNALFKLLNGKRHVKGGSVQVLWYELAEQNPKNSIHEFQKINTGNIRLTDAELVKGLFLQSRNFESGNKYIKQSELAIQWEFIENTLHANDFWYFLQKKGNDMPNRIDFLFSLIYKVNELRDIGEEAYDNQLKEIDAKISDPRQSIIFRYYYNRFEGKRGEVLQKEVTKAWDEVMEMYRLLDHWFCTPALYNYIGLLSWCGEDIVRLVTYFNNLPDDSTSAGFLDYVRKRIKKRLNVKIEIDEEGKHQIMNRYKERMSVFNLLLALNVELLNEQNTLSHSKSEAYKFPFDVFESQNWNLEHIDSFHTNSLKKNEAKRDWITMAMEDCKSELENHADRKQEIETLIDTENYDAAIKELKKLAGEEEADDEVKNRIWNLTLLDEHTNKRYGNSLFRRKRRIIIEQMERGVFVPIATQYIFYKFFDKDATNRSTWTKKDMATYQEFIFSKLSKFISSDQ